MPRLLVPVLRFTLRPTLSPPGHMSHSEETGIWPRRCPEDHALRTAVPCVPPRCCPLASLILKSSTSPCRKPPLCSPFFVFMELYSHAAGLWLCGPHRGPVTSVCKAICCLRTQILPYLLSADCSVSCVNGIETHLGCVLVVLITTAGC